jgi:putative DNA-invertase from lambdoid prophage Rac
MVKIFGYIRVSTEKQSVLNQKQSIINKAIDLQLNDSDLIWVNETKSGRLHFNKRLLGKQILHQAEPGDIIICTEISRLGRKFIHIMEFIAKCSERKIKIYISNSSFKIDDSLESQCMIFAYSLSSQIERELISQRTKAGLDRARREGRYGGRPKGSHKLIEHIDKIKYMVNNGVTNIYIAKKYNVTPTTVCRFIKDFELRKNNNLSI